MGYMNTSPHGAAPLQGRYQLDDTSGAQEGQGPRVRAVQGHSIELPNPMHDPIRGPHEVPIALHATSEERSGASSPGFFMRDATSAEVGWELGALLSVSYGRVPAACRRWAVGWQTTCP
jgi:hypothetical protein